MSYFYIGVGGTGAKMMQTLIHLGAAGMFPEPGRKLQAMQVDSDLSNGNISYCKEIYNAYQSCHKLQLGEGNCDLFKPEVLLKEPWTPVRDPDAVTLGDIFGYIQKKNKKEMGPDLLDADLMDVLFEPEEIEEKVREGFRGRPAIGSVILANTIDFKTPGTDWYKLKQDMENASGAYIPVLLAGSIFGGTGAAGVPTVLKMLADEVLGDPAAAADPENTGAAAAATKYRLGLTLFLPYFTYSKVIENGVEVMQADPSEFSGASAEALKYYYEHEFLKVCKSIYAIGETKPAMMPVSAVGAEKQRNAPHFVELIAGLGAMQFFGPRPDDKHTFALAARKQEQTLTWEDLPATDGRDGQQLKKLKKMILFCVAFRFFFYKEIAQASDLGKVRFPWVQNHLLSQGLNLDTARTEFKQVNDYVTYFLAWLLDISTPQGVGPFRPGLADVNVFAEVVDGAWRIKDLGDPSVEKLLPQLFLNSQVKPSYKQLWSAAGDKLKIPGASGPGLLVRAIYDACCSTNKF